MWISQKKLNQLIADCSNEIVKQRVTEANNLAMVMTNSVLNHTKNKRHIIASCYGMIATGMLLTLKVLHEIDVQEELKELVKNLNTLE